MPAPALRLFYDLSEGSKFHFRFLYVGRSTHRTLSKYGIHTIGDLACTDPDFLLKTLGKMGLVIHSFANGWDEKYSKYFGFTVDEVNTMAAYYGQEAKLEELREWYDGYRFGSTEIYNPWSVANYFYNNCQAKPYWANTVRQVCWTPGFEMRSTWETLFCRKAIQPTSFPKDVL